MTRLGIALLRWIGHRPLSWGRFLGSVVGTLFYLISAERRGIALTNLALCFPELEPRARRRLARAHFRAFGRSVFDRGFLWWGPAERVRERVTWVGREHLDAARARAPVILLAPHFVGLDAGGLLASLHWQVVSIYAAQKNPEFDRAVLQGRMRFNAPLLLSRQDSVRGAVRALRDGLPLYYLPDMDFGARDSVFVPFFGVAAATLTTTARLAKVAGALVVPYVTRMTATGYEVRIYPAWEDYPGADITAATARMNAFIEARVLEMPEQYLWTHKRFKTRPAGAPSLYPKRR